MAAFGCYKGNSCVMRCWIGIHKQVSNLAAFCNLILNSCTPSAGRETDKYPAVAEPIDHGAYGIGNIVQCRNSDAVRQGSAKPFVSKRNQVVNRIISTKISDNILRNSIDQLGS